VVQAILAQRVPGVIVVTTVAKLALDLEAAPRRRTSTRSPSCG
jgi:hypothetical protein